MKNIVFWVLIAALAGFSASLYGVGDTGKGYKWQIDDLVTPDRVGEYQVSPDGKWLVWTVMKWDLKEQKRYSQVFLTDLKEKGDDIQLTRGQDRFDSIRWVPGEPKISFKTSRKFKNTKEDNLWLMNVGGGEPYPLTDFEHGLTRYEWLDRDRLLFVSREIKSLHETQKKEQKDTSEVVEDETHRLIYRLFQYDVKTKKATRLTANSKPLARLFLSPDKKWLVYSLSMSLLFEQNQEIRPKFYLMNLETMETREIFSDPSIKPDGTFRWSVDSSGLYAYIDYSSHPRYTMVAVRKIYWYELKSGAYREVDLGWDRYGGNLTITPGGFIMALPDGVRYKYARYYKTNHTWKRQWIRGEWQNNIQILKLSEDGKTVVYGYSTAARPIRYYLSELKGNRFAEKREVMKIDSPLYKRPLTKREIITWKGALDDTVEGILYYPLDYEEGMKYPLILMIHGGPHGADRDFFRDNLYSPAHLMCERGAFVLKVNYHGSSSYGLAFAESIAGHYYEYEVPDLETGVDRLITGGKVDPDKLGIIGWSNGAILGTALTVHTNRYKAASLGAGDVNWTSDYGNCRFGVAFDNYYFGGPPWQRLEHYLKKSPLFRLHQVTTPTLIFHGDKDRAVPYEQGWEYYRALQVLGKTPVRFITFPGEGHGPRKLAHQRRKLQEEIAWFEKYLFGTHKEKNESLKKGSPLDKLAAYLKIAKKDGIYGLIHRGLLVPEVVTFKKKQVGRFEVTRAQWAAFDSTYVYEKGTDNLPVTGITFEQAREYAAWLSRKTGETYRLPQEKEAEDLYGKRGGNTFDYWAGYTLNPDDYRSLVSELKKYGDQPVLLKPVGSFTPLGENPVFDLDGNAAEWVEFPDGSGKTCGGSADRTTDDKSRTKPTPLYTGLRILKH